MRLAPAALTLTLVRAALFRARHTREVFDIGDNKSMRISVRKGDVAILIGAAAIAVYEKRVEDDEDLISCRVASYKATHPVLTYAVVALTALHVLDLLPVEVDPYHQLVRYFRNNVVPGE